VQLFLDLDGVLADFDTGYERVFGYKPDKALDNADWAAVASTPGFYQNLPPMPDASLLWSAVAHLTPIVLTGVPHAVKEAPENKRAWVRAHLGNQVDTRCCRSAEKATHANPGDVLVDDWTKYKHLWERAGGVWVTHTSAVSTVAQLQRLGVL
jgi:hypothetical protein